jgi:predicted O-methyltransferase YrrM
MKIKNSTTYYKLNKFIEHEIKNKKNIKILEFGVQNGYSTDFFLNICKKNNGELISIDTNPTSYVNKYKKWQFIKCRDDNYKTINKVIKNYKFDLIFLDTEHTPKHVLKIFYQYYKFIKIGGIFLIDDISWLPYTINNYRNNEWVEVNNRNTFDMLIEIYQGNFKALDLELFMPHSGMAKFTKLKNNITNPIKISDRRNNLKQIAKKFFK